MKLPKTIYLLDGEYLVKVVKTDDLALKNKVGVEYSTVAALSSKDKIIYIDIADPDVMINFWHEIGHHFADYYGFASSEVFAEAFAKLVVNVSEQLK